MSRAALSGPDEAETFGRDLRKPVFDIVDEGDGAGKQGRLHAAGPSRFNDRTRDIVDVASSPRLEIAEHARADIGVLFHRDGQNKARKRAFEELFDLMTVLVKAFAPIDLCHA